MRVLVRREVEAWLERHGWARVPRTVKHVQYARAGHRVSISQGGKSHELRRNVPQYMRRVLRKAGHTEEELAELFG